MRTIKAFLKLMSLIVAMGLMMFTIVGMFCLPALIWPWSISLFLTLLIISFIIGNPNYLQGYLDNDWQSK